MSTKTAPTTKTTVAKTETNGEMSEHKIIILKLLKVKEMSLEQLAEKTKLTRRAVYHAVYHLRADSYLKESAYEGSRARVFSPTAKGLKAIK